MSVLADACRALDRKRRSVVIQNMSFLMAMQLANYVFPLITVPYLVRVLGIELFGLISFAISFVQYFVILTDFSFNLTATRSISIHRDDHVFVSREFWSVFLVKGCIMVVSVAIYVALVLLVDKFAADRSVYLLCIFAIVGNFLFPVWYFQGIERMKYIAIINVGVRFLFTVAVFILVRQRGDYLTAVALQTVGPAVGGAVAIAIIATKHPVQLIAPTAESLRRCVREGRDVFMTIAAATLVNNSNLFILGMFADKTMTGFFAVAEKVVRVAINVSAPINAAIFPRIGQSFGTADRRDGTRYLRHVLKYGSLLFAAMGIALLFGADTIVLLVSGQSNAAISTMIRIMSFVPLSIFVDNLYGTQVLVNIGEGRAFLMAVLIPGILSVLGSLVFVPVWQGYATATIFTVAELLVLALMAFSIKRNGFSLLFRTP